MSTVYRSGTPKKAKKLDKDLHNTIKLMSLDKEYSQIVIAGDFNHPDSLILPKSKHNTNHHDNVFIDCTNDSLLQQHITKPTRYRDHQNPTVDDLILANDDNTISDLKYLHHLGASDHITLLILISAMTSLE